MLKKLSANFPFILLILGYVLYLVLLIYRSSFLISGERHFVLVDDMMISMKYAKNLALGNGLVWNIGERVEGITNPLWTSYMSFWHLFNISASKISIAIQLTNVFLLVLSLFVVKKIAEVVSKKSLLVIIFSVILTASFFQINNFALLGTEVAALSLILFTSIMLSLFSLKKKTVNPLIYLILALGTFVRMDAAVPYLAILLFFLIYEKKKRILHLKWGFGVLLTALLVQTGLRLYYYGEILPNTYYLKMTGYPVVFRITRGVYELLEYMWQTGIILFVLPLILLKKSSREIALLFFVFFSLVLYSIYVGGDAFEDPGRYITVGMPIFFILFSLGSKKILYAIFPQNSKFKIIAAIYLLTCVVMFNSTTYDTFLESTLIKKPSYVGSAKLNVEMAYEISKLTGRDAVVAVTFAGTIPYFTERKYIDLLGKSDKHIAREESKEPYGSKKDMPEVIRFFPGHTKWDNNYAIKQLKPDVVVSPPDIESMREYLNNNYENIQVGYGTIYLKKGYKKNH